MGAGLSKEQDRAAKQSGLRSILRDLHKAGVDCQYKKMAVTGTGFSVTYGETLRASNGECFGRLHVQVDGRDYWLLEANAGLARIKAVYGGEKDQLAIAELAWLVILVERAVHKGCQRENLRKPEFDVFLHNPDGTRFNTIPCTGMAKGQIYAYNEMQGGRPMLRIGPGSEYTEFLPGMTVRWGTGEIIAERKE